ncbi:hypothetical protein JTE90_005645 [Oedothorax gibbosus]|uniref:Uncharacterized protein n=1 Tax=Oedothorax gibbosus TaxID=931172 RepID=A0AAV6UHP4_9ARAC|nr:hypothetical protein JTE90_005645 [Oedothorax gibbosus]
MTTCSRPTKARVFRVQVLFCFNATHFSVESWFSEGGDPGLCQEIPIMDEDVSNPDLATTYTFLQRTTRNDVHLFKAQSQSHVSHGVTIVMTKIITLDVPKK